MGKVEDLDKVRRARGKAGGDSAAEPAAGKGRRRCPICGRPAVQRHRPFCSPRCADVDLGRWIGGDYRIPGTPVNALNSGEEEGEDEG
jgi:endogenous inhibitor of DNA gyrase (YacG/DUF329 family)